MSGTESQKMIRVLLDVRGASATQTFDERAMEFVSEGNAEFEVVLEREENDACPEYLDPE